MRGRRRGTERATETVRRDESGQASIEYLIVFFALLAIVVGLAALWRFGETGGYVARAREAASHLAGEGGVLEALQDATLF